MLKFNITSYTPKTKIDNRGVNDNTEYYSKDLEGEIWKDYGENYKISNKGRVRSLLRGKDIILKFNKDKDGYNLVSIKKDNETKFSKLKVHRMVLEAFVPNPNNLPDCNHKNKDKSNNDVENLEWCSRRNNLIHGTGKKVEKLNKITLEVIDEYDCIADAASANNLRYQNISACCNGRIPSSGGFKWRFKI